MDAWSPDSWRFETTAHLYWLTTYPGREWVVADAPGKRTLRGSRLPCIGIDFLLPTLRLCHQKWWKIPTDAVRVSMPGCGKVEPGWKGRATLFRIMVEAPKLRTEPARAYRAVRRDRL